MTGGQNGHRAAGSHAGDPEADARVWAWRERGTHIIERVKTRRRIPLHRPIPAGYSRWDTLCRCQRPGCRCTCDRGWIGDGPVSPCPNCPPPTREATP